MIDARYFWLLFAGALQAAVWFVKGIGWAIGELFHKWFAPPPPPPNPVPTWGHLAVKALEAQDAVVLNVCSMIATAPFPC